MQKLASIIGNDNSILNKSIKLIESKNLQLKYIFYKNTNYQLLDKIDYLFIDNELPETEKEELLKYSFKNNKKLYIIPNIVEIINARKYSHFKDMLVFTSKSFQQSLFQRFIKRLFDIIFSIIIILLLLPIIIIIYLSLKIFDPGPAIYLQKRLTINQREFILYKFRTMINNAEKMSGATLSWDNDYRITRIGKFLRKTRFDEIPQIFNVLIGDMSIVGPRPERRYFARKFITENEFYKYRFNVKAGITGLAQINSYYNTNFTDKLNFDLLYISTYNLFNDIKIIIKTFKVLFDENATKGTKEESFEEIIQKNNMELKEIEPGIIELRKNDENNNIKLQ